MFRFKSASCILASAHETEKSSYGGKFLSVVALELARFIRQPILLYLVFEAIRT